MNSQVIARIGRPDGTAGWHRRYQREQQRITAERQHQLAAERQHALARLVWQTEVQQLAAQLTDG